MNGNQETSFLNKIFSKFLISINFQAIHWFTLTSSKICDVLILQITQNQFEIQQNDNEEFLKMPSNAKYFEQLT